MDKNEIVIYQSKDDEFRLEVEVDKETVWLNLNQMSELFQRDKSVISRHINNVFKEKELDRKAVVAKNAITASDGKIYNVDYYNLDIIISVGYRVKSLRGTQFRIWANTILKEYLLRGHVVNHRINNIEQKLAEHDKKIELLINTNITSSEGIFYDGQIYDAYVFMADIIRSAKCSIIVIDNYVDDSVLTMLLKRNKGVRATIYTQRIEKIFKLDLKRHNEQYDTVNVREIRNVHDRFVIIDEEVVYHIGASLKDLGKKWFAFSRINIDIEGILRKLG